jgi:hypothetical protein
MRPAVQRWCLRGIQILPNKLPLLRYCRRVQRILAQPTIRMFCYTVTQPFTGRRAMDDAKLTRTLG